MWVFFNINRSQIMKKISVIWITMLLVSFNLQAQLQLVNLNDLKEGKEHHQAGQLPVFESALWRKNQADLPMVSHDPLYNIYSKNNLMAVVDGQLVVFPKELLSISNGYSPFKDLMNISNGFLKLKVRKGVGHWSAPGISNGMLHFTGFASLKSMHLLQDTATTLSSNEVEDDQDSSNIISDDPGYWDDDDDYDIRLDLFLDELARHNNPWDMVTVMVDGVLVEMSAGALAAHLGNGAFILAGGDRRMPEFP